MKSETSGERTAGKSRRNRRLHTARVKGQAVLTVWAEKRRAGTVCRELGISWGILSQWEQKALQGMLQGLGQPETPGTPGVSLGRRLERLLSPPAPAGEPSVPHPELTP